MIKFFRFILICLAGLAGISMLYYSINNYLLNSHLLDINDYDTVVIATVVAVVEAPDEDILLLSEADTIYKSYPVIEYRFDTKVYRDSAKHWADYEAYVTGDSLEIFLNRNNLEDYINSWEAEVSNDAGFLIVFVVFGIVLMVIFLGGLAKIFAYRERI